jgi:putative membrane protein
MKQNSISFLRLTVMTVAVAVAVAVASLSLVANIGAQVENTSVSDNPHLRKKTEPAKAPTTKLSDKDRKFLQLAANAGVGEVADGQQAQSQAQSAEVKRIGAQMVADHSRANNELQALAKKKGLSMEMGGGKPRAFPKATFDHQYLYNLEEDHKADIKTFEQEAKSGDDADVKAWAAKTVPTLKSHLAMVKDARKKVK